jgi:hypothetical protein
VQKITPKHKSATGWPPGLCRRNMQKEPVGGVIQKCCLIKVEVGAFREECEAHPCPKTSARVHVYKPSTWTDHSVLFHRQRFLFVYHFCLYMLPLLGRLLQHPITWAIVCTTVTCFLGANSPRPWPCRRVCHCPSSTVQV